MSPSARMLWCSIAIASTLTGSGALAGDLNPPAGPVAPTPGPEPRTPINLTTTPGDANSIYKITAAGSYYLAGNLAGVVGKHGIEITASNVTVDLMGFEVLGVAGSLDGITTSGASPSAVEVRNGTVRSWGDDGIDLLSSSRSVVTGVRSLNNAGSGIEIGFTARVTDCVIADNTGLGISVDSATIITGCTVRNAGSHGIQAGVACTISQCTVVTCGGDGYFLTLSTEVSRCIAADNAGNGITISSDCLVIENTCDGNGNGSSDGANILVTGSDNRIEGNNCTDGDRGIDVNGTGNLIIRNTCAGNTTNWDIVIGNSYGPIVVAGTNAGATTGVGPFASTLGSTDPNANYSY